MGEMSQREASNGLVRRLYKIHLSPYQKFKKRALSIIKDKEDQLQRISETFASNINKNDVHQLNMVEKVVMGKEIEQTIKAEKEKLTHDS